MIKISVNGKELEVPDKSSLADAIKLVPGVPNQGVAAAVNMEVVPTPQWDATQLANGDKITIIRAFNGG